MMNNQAFWLQKINAFLHDPPDKPLDIKDHQGQAQRWANALGLTFSGQDYKQADWIASAADRLNFPSYRKIGGADFRKAPYLTHPLAGVPLNLGEGNLLPKNIDDQKSIEAIYASLLKIPDNIKNDPQALFLWLWRNWSSQIQASDGNQLGVLWDLLPADTRIPDHSIWSHQALTSTIAATADANGNPDPAFLLLTIGPVQAFISAARRTQDLWAGSYLLSYLNWAAIQVVAETIGPDAVIFPNLIGQPLCDRWLSQKGIIAQPRSEDLILPSLPNRFLAIVPKAQGAELARQASETVRSQWREITQTVRQDLERLWGNPIKWSNTWERQTENFFEIYWQVYPWRPTGSEPIKSKDYKQFVDVHKPYLGKRYEAIDRILQVYAKKEKDGGGQYEPNIGAIYRDLYFITEKTLGSRKGLRNFPQVPETGEKSTLGGDRATLYDGIDDLSLPESDFDGLNRKGHGRQKIIQFWQELAKKLQQQGRFDIQETGQERLDAVELTKRSAWRSYLEDYLGVQPSQELDDSDSAETDVPGGTNTPDTEAEKEAQRHQLRFPSTSSVATASFKQTVLEKAVGQEAQPLRKALRDWVYAVKGCKSVRLSNRILPSVIPYLAQQLNSSDILLRDFLTLDGRLLFEETYEDLERNQAKQSNTQLEINQIRQVLGKLKKFLKVATSEPYSIQKPRKYFAVLMMDGDRMGEWIAGNPVLESQSSQHAQPTGVNLPLYQQVLHPKTKIALENKDIWQDILDTPRLMSPAIHGFISKALGDFSLKLVRHIVENRYPGKLVYAGGDDVLALLPVDCALTVARELRAAFSGEVYTGEIGSSGSGQDLQVVFHDPQHPKRGKSGYVWLQLPGEDQPRLLASMGHKATASTGIAIAHHTQPLDLTLNAVREAEKAAKNYEGRNAFSITFLKRSGEEMRAGAKWVYANKSVDTVEVLLSFQKRFADGSISSKFPYILREESETLTLIENEALYKAEIKRLLLRQQGSNKLSQSNKEKMAEEMAEKLAHLVTMANDEKRSLAKTQNKSKPQGKLKNFADLLIFTRFLATNEGEG